MEPGRGMRASCLTGGTRRDNASARLVEARKRPSPVAVYADGFFEIPVGH